MANVVSALVGYGPFTVLASAARTATPDTLEFELPSGVRALYLFTDATAITSTPSITVMVQAVDRVSGKALPASPGVLSGAAIVAVGSQVLKIGVGLTAAANAVANDYPPTILRVTVTHANANPITYSVAGLLVG